MYVVAALLLALLSAYGQSHHTHTMTENCKGQPDRVYGKSDGVYYACVKGKAVCSQEKVAIPANLIAAFDTGIVVLEHKTATRPEARLPDVKPAGMEMLRGTTLSSVEPPLIAARIPPRPAIAEELVRGIPIGTAQDDVIQKLGEPYMKISGSVEYFAYLLTSKNTAKLEFTNGKLTQLRIAPAR